MMDTPGLHASFKLDKGGEQIYLADTDTNFNQVLDFIAFGAQMTDVSYGRSAGNADVWTTMTPTPGAVFHDPTQRRRWSRRQRQRIFRLLLLHFGRRIGSMAKGNQHVPATAWRLTVEAWLRCQGLISVRRNYQPGVSTTSPKLCLQLNWTHNDERHLHQYGGESKS